MKVGKQIRQVQCGCIDTYSKQLRKQKTTPLSMKVLNAGTSQCKVCHFMPWVVLPRAEAFTLLTEYTKSKCDCTNRHKETGNLCLACRTKEGK